MLACCKVAKDTRVFSMSMKSDETRGEYIKIMEISYVKTLPSLK